MMSYLDLWQAFRLFFFLKYNVKSLPAQYYKYFNVKNTKIKPPAALFENKIMKLYLFLKA